MQLSNFIIIHSHQYKQNINSLNGLKNKRILFINCFYYFEPHNLKQLSNNDIYFLEKSHYKKIYKNNSELLAKLSGDIKFGITCFTLNSNDFSLNIIDFVEFEINDKNVNEIAQSADYLIDNFIEPLTKKLSHNDINIVNDLIETKIFPINININENDKELFFEMNAKDALHIIECFSNNDNGQAYIIHNKNKIYINDASLIETFDTTIPKTCPSEFGKNVVSFKHDALKIRSAYFEDGRCALKYFCSDNFPINIFI